MRQCSKGTALAISAVLERSWSCGKRTCEGQDLMGNGIVETPSRAEAVVSVVVLSDAMAAATWDMPSRWQSDLFVGSSDTVLAVATRTSMLTGSRYGTVVFWTQNDSEVGRNSLTNT